MGRKSAAPSGLAGALFSRVQLRVLGLLFGQPDRQFQASELIRLAGSGSGAVQRELKTLTEAGIVAVTKAGDCKLYHANRNSPIFPEVHGLIVKTVGLVEPLRRALKRYEGKIDGAFVFGSVALGTDTARSDIDLMIIADDLPYSEIYAALQKAEKELQRPINPSLMSARDWKRKQSDARSFATRVARAPKLFVFGTEHEQGAR